jgi:osmotically-inducible protein OsmY
MNTRMKKIVMAGALIAAASAVSAQAADQSATSPTIVNGQRETPDQRITNDVVDKLSNDPRLSRDSNGDLGVETERGVVDLSGVVTTPGDKDRAESDARSVDGVKDVNDNVRARVGEDF